MVADTYHQAYGGTGLTSGGKPIRAGGKPGRTDPRGNAASRRARKTKLLSDPQFHHNEVGKDVLCSHCSRPLEFRALEQDREKPGGPYAYHNIIPSCRNCNLEKKNDPNWTGPNPTQPTRKPLGNDQ